MVAFIELSIKRAWFRGFVASFGREMQLLKFSSSWSRSKFMEPEQITELHQLYEAAKPKNQPADVAKKHLVDLYDKVQPNFEKLMKRPDTSRILQLIFRRGDEEIRTKFLTDFIPLAELAATTKHSEYIFQTVVKHGAAKNINQLYEGLIGKFHVLFSHKKGLVCLDLLYQHLNLEQKKRVFLDLYGKDFRKPREILTLKEICDKGGPQRKSALEATKAHLFKALDKNGGKLKIVQRLLLTLLEINKDYCNDFCSYIHEIAFSSEGSEAAVIIIKNSKPKTISAALRLMEEKENKPVIPKPGQPAAAEEEEEADEEDKNEGDANEEEEVGEEGGEKKEELTEAEIKKLEEIAAQPTSKASEMALDKFAFVVLSCAISYLHNEISVVQTEVLPNLLQDWELLKKSVYGLRVLLRIIKPVPSVYRSLEYQRDSVDEGLVDIAVPLLMNVVITDIKEVGLIPDGTKLALAILAHLQGKDEFDQLANVIFTEENIVDKVMNKMIRGALQNNIKPCAQICTDLINNIGMSTVLKTPGAWVVVELCQKHKAMLKEAKKAIKQDHIEGKAIDSLLHPRQEDVGPKRKEPQRKKSSK